MRRLVLFDIDGTLVLTGGAGGRAIARAFADVFQMLDPVRTVSMAGRTDSWIFSELAARHGLVLDVALADRIRSVYLSHLATEIQAPGPEKGILPGVRALLDLLSGREDVHLALLTGNLRQGAQIKLEYFDLWRYFSGGGFGDAALDRTDLYSEALASVEAQSGVRFSAEDSVIVGDTPLDIAVARGNGARSVGVATGAYDSDVLKAAGADVVLTDLSEVAAVLKALGV